jgi:hypothetical protein
VKTAQQAAEAWAQSAGRAATNYQAGIQNTNADWAGRTKAQRSVMLANLNQAVNSGLWDQGIDRVGNGGWKSRTVAKIGNYSTGFTAGASRQASAIGKILSAEANIVGSLPPRGTFEQNKARATAVMDQLHALRGQLGAS